MVLREPVSDQPVNPLCQCDHLPGFTFRDRAGHLVASVAQEGLIRPTRD